MFSASGFGRAPGDGGSKPFGSEVEPVQRIIFDGIAIDCNNDEKQEIIGAELLSNTKETYVAEKDG